MFNIYSCLLLLILLWPYISFGILILILKLFLSKHKFIVLRFLYLINSLQGCIFRLLVYPWFCNKRPIYSRFGSNATECMFSYQFKYNISFGFSHWNNWLSDSLPHVQNRVRNDSYNIILLLKRKLDILQLLRAQL